MKEIREVSNEEMKERFPAFMAAFNDMPNAMNCDYCDGLRLKDHECFCYACKASRKAPNLDCETCVILQKSFGV